MLADLGADELFYNPLTDSDQTEEYARFRSLTSELVEDPSLIAMGSDAFSKVVYFVDHYSRANLWSEFYPIPPESGDSDKKWRSVGESLVGKEPIDSSEKRNLDPARFSSLLRELVGLEQTSLQDRLNDILETKKMDPTSLFAAQYAEAIKLRREVDPILKKYENLRLAYASGDIPNFNQSVTAIRSESNVRAGDSRLRSALKNLQFLRTVLQKFSRLCCDFLSGVYFMVTKRTNHFRWANRRIGSVLPQLRLLSYPDRVARPHLWPAWEDVY